MKNIKFIILLIIFTLFFLIGCAQQVRQTSTIFLGKERVYNKNYIVGKQNMAYVGQPIVKVKDYTIRKYKSNKTESTNEFKMSLGAHNFSGTKGEKFNIFGKTKVNNKEYKMIVLDSLNTPGFKIAVLIDSHGEINLNTTLVKSVLTSDFLDLGFKLSVNPNNLRFKSINENEIDVDAGFLNYELIYGGNDGKSFSISYREYTSNDLARPAFYQDLTYQVNQKKIRFKDTIIEVYEVSNEKIIYKVVSDNLKKIN